MLSRERMQERFLELVQIYSPSGWGEGAVPMAYGLF